MLLTQKTYEQMPEGVQQVVIAGIAEEGSQPNPYYNPEDPKSQPKQEKITFFFANAKGEEALKIYTASLNEKATLAKDLKSLLGSFQTNLDTNALVGRQLQIVVAHEVKNGKPRATVGTWLKPLPGQNVPRPNKTYAPILKKKSASPKPAAASIVADGTTITDEDIPF